MSETMLRDYQMLLARTQTVHRPVGPLAYDCVKVIIVRHGSAVLFSEFGQKPVRPGDVILLGPNVLCGSEPEEHITITTIYADTDYVIDQAFWQHAGILHDRLDAMGFAEKLYSHPAQILRLGEDRTGMMMAWLEEMVALSLDGQFQRRFHRLQALWFAIMDVVTPYVRVSPVRLTPLQRARSRLVLPRTRRFAPLRREALLAREALHERVAHPWTLRELAKTVRLSPQQLSRVFADAYGKTPIAYLTMLRVQEMARLLRETDLPVAATGRQVGWSSRSRATEAFIEHTGLSPSRYRAMRPIGTDHRMWTNTRTSQRLQTHPVGRCTRRLDSRQVAQREWIDLPRQRRAAIGCLAQSIDVMLLILQLRCEGVDSLAQIRNPILQPFTRDA
ncbi:helix-turn-helix transcriptional regulator [Kocuria sp. CPCC 205297]|uniref:helix-turn-helix transcriptional regulator n=1 Tax=Kocuria sp. CPCC 205297 TaxID=3073558 RepID=UPI0034D3BC5E